MQLGVGLSRGPQIFALAVRLALESSPGSVVCKLDFKNAFNTCSRRAFLRYTATKTKMAERGAAPKAKKAIDKKKAERKS